MVGTVRSGEVVEVFPFGQFCFQIDISFVAEKLIEFLLVRSVRPLDFAIKLGRAGFDVGVADAFVLDMPVEFSLELVTIIGPDFFNPEWEFLDDMVNKVDGVCLGVAVINLKRSYTGCVINGRVLEPPCFLTTFSYECQELNVHLNVMARNLFLIPLGMNLAGPCSAWQPVHVVPA